MPCHAMPCYATRGYVDTPTPMGLTTHQAGPTYILPRASARARALLAAAAAHAAPPAGSKRLLAWENGA
jgi:hypothetical protein